MRTLLLVAICLAITFIAHAGKGAFVRISNLTSSSLSYNTSDAGCMDPCDLNGSIAAYSAIGGKYIEGGKNWCFGAKDFTLKFSHPKGSASIYFVVVSDHYFARDVTSNGIQIDYTIEGKHDLIGSDDQYLIEITISEDKIEGKNWMSFLSGETKLAALSIPGTHDSGADNGSLLPYVQTQYMSIPAQLSSGIRYLDMRGYSDGKFSKAGVDGNWFSSITGEKFDGDCDIQVTHGPIRMPYSFSMLLNDVAKFLAENDQEVVIIQVKEDEGSGMLEKFNCLLSKLADPRTSTSSSDSIYVNYVKAPTDKLMLKDCRGKIVFTSRIGGEFGFKLSYPENDIGKTGSFQIQDVYEPDPKTFERAATKKYEIAKKFHEDYASGKYKNQFNINFLSVAKGVFTPLINCVKINYSFQKFLNGKTNRFNSIILMDGVEKDSPLLKSIIYNNYLK